MVLMHLLAGSVGLLECWITETKHNIRLGHGYLCWTMACVHTLTAVCAWRFVHRIHTHTLNNQCIPTVRVYHMCRDSLVISDVHHQEIKWKTFRKPTAGRRIENAPDDLWVMWDGAERLPKELILVPAKWGFLLANVKWSFLMVSAKQGFLSINTQGIGSAQINQNKTTYSIYHKTQKIKLSPRLWLDGN